MSHLILQIWGGLFSLLNKVCFSRAERNEGELKRKWRISAWVSLLVSHPSWIIINFLERNWIVVAVIFGVIPSVIVGLIISVRGRGHEPKWLDYIARIAAVFGIAYSIYDFGGITTINQMLELGVAVGLLAGTYLLAKQLAIGYLFFALLNISSMALMGIQGYYWLMFQQFISLYFVADAYFVYRRRTTR
jgi:hypothetical protein